MRHSIQDNYVRDIYVQDIYVQDIYVWNIYFCYINVQDIYVCNIYVQQKICKEIMVETGSFMYWTFIYMNAYV